MKIVLAGGGTGGPTVPLLAVASEIKKQNPATEFLFIGSKSGPEQQLVADKGIRFQAISTGKLRRYFSLNNFFDLFRIYAGYNQSLKILKDFKPDVVFSVGSFVAIPVCFAAKKLKIKVVIHQQDATIGLANKLVAPFAAYITTAFAQTAKDFYSGSGFEKEPLVKTEWVGNPVRPEFFDSTPGRREAFNLKSDLPVLLITGGATGAAQINQVVAAALPELVKAHEVIHITGPGKNKINFRDPAYHPYEFLSKEMPDAMKVADIVVTRAGLSTIAELSALGKIAVIVPMPGTHQEANAAIVKNANAAVVLSKEEFDPETLARVIVSLKFNQKRCELLSSNMKNLMPHNSASRIAEIILKQK